MAGAREPRTPAGTPPRIRAFGSEVRQLGVGRPGKTGMLRVDLARDGASGRTVIRRLRCRPPLHVQRALHCGDGDDGGNNNNNNNNSNGRPPGPACVYIASTSGGILQGDRYRIDIGVGEGARAHVTTQGATRVYGMDSDYATQAVNVTVGDGAYLELVPDQIIPYRDSRFYQEATLNVHSNATVVYAEVITPGRVAMGESFAYDVCHLKTVATDQDGNYRFVDVASIQPGTRDVSSLGVLGGHRVVGSAYILARRRDVPGLYARIGEAISGNGDVFGGVTVMKDDSGLLARVLGDGTEAVKGAILDAVAALRDTAIGAPFTGIRKS